MIQGGKIFHAVSCQDTVPHPADGLSQMLRAGQYLHLPENL